MQRFWEAVVEPILEAVEPGGILEIGSDKGLNTAKLLAFCERNDATLHVIDPLPKYDVEEWREKYGGRLVFHQDLSLAAIPRVEGLDVALIDGDHNWYTVFNELKLIESRCEELAKPFPLVMFHDIGWPYGRRDLYYDPENIPEAHRQPHEQKGMRIGSSGLLDEGGVNAHLHNATHEGGSRNGIRTAVEDFMRETENELDLLVIPILHGLGILVPLRLREQNEGLATLLESLAGLKGHASPVAGVMDLAESERLKAEAARQEARTQNQRLKNQLERERAKVRHLGGQAERLERLFSAVFASRQWRIAHALGELNRRLARRPRRPTAAGQIAETLREIRAWRGGGDQPPRSD